MLKKNVHTLRQRNILLLILLFTLSSCNQKTPFTESSSTAAQGAGKSSVNDQTTTTTNGTTGSTSDISGAPPSLSFGLPSYEYDTNHIEQIMVVTSSSIPWKMTQKGFPKDYKIGDVVQCPLKVKFNGFGYTVRSADFDPSLMSSDSCDRHTISGPGQVVNAFSMICDEHANVHCNVPQPITGQIQFTSYGLQASIQLNSLESCAQDPTHAGNVISYLKPGINLVTCNYYLDSWIASNPLVF